MTRFILRLFQYLYADTILTDNGVECERIGKIPTVKTDNIKRTSFYSTVKGIYHGKISLDRATKNPKKGVSYIAL